MNERLLSALKSGVEVLPSCQDYANLLDYAHIMKGIGIPKLRRTMGLATYAQWATFLNVV